MCLFGGSGISLGTGFLHPLGRIPPDASRGFDIEERLDIIVTILKEGELIIVARVMLLRRTEGSAYICGGGWPQKITEGPTRRDTACSVRFAIGRESLLGTVEEESPGTATLEVKQGSQGYMMRGRV